ncbi:MAG: DUF169 domain-containing protein [Deltaproteobacteria bacterium]|nr:DUF169 domain-containing protein [Deltaproteobacteria bacterium]
MNDLKGVSHDLVQRLSLDYEPVGVAFFRQSDRLPEGVSFAQKELKSYCQALVLAGKGESLLLGKEQMGCKLGTSVLGFETDMEAYLDDGVLEKYGVGLYATEEASAETILKSTYLEKGNTEAVFIAPLSQFAENPEVVIFTANSEQVMWLLYAVNYETGGKMNLPQSGGALGGCSDITVLPMLEGISNITFLGLGCRIKSAIDPCDLMMGVPGNRVAMLHGHIVDMAKPIAMLNKLRSGA